MNNASAPINADNELTTRQPPLLETIGLESGLKGLPSEPWFTGMICRIFSPWAARRVDFEYNQHACL